MVEPLDKSMTQEAALLEKLTRIEENPSGCFAVHIHLSQLRPNNRQPHFINIAARAFDNLVNSADAILYSMMNQDIVLVCREVMVEDIDPYIEKIRTLFSEDPLASDQDEYEDRLSTWYDLASKEDFAAFFSVSSELVVKAEAIIDEMKRARGTRRSERRRSVDGTKPCSHQPKAPIDAHCRLDSPTDLYPHLAWQSR